ncbi:unnamed protein product [Prorocentrum cordatum]|uniref:Uncharacterized protein n=1 Tax=Prorocentrum cordatum TaxID=2364126 RepID=A0ABN9TL70_9DINO|nr:unnamed protein product [Polarella glacialis]
MPVKPLDVSAGSPVQYYSTSHGGWIDCVVDETNPKGEVQISVKKGYWMSPAEQSQRLRLPPGEAGVALEGAGAAAEPAGGGAPWAVEQAVALGLHGAEGLDWAVALSRKEVSSVNKAVEKLSRGEIECAGDFCVAFSASSQNNYLLYRRGCKEQALAKLVANFRDATAARAALRTELSAARAEARTAATFEAEAEAADKLSRSAEAKLAASCLEESQMQRLCDERARSLHEAEERLRSAAASRSALEALEADAVRDLEARLAGSEQDASALRAALAQAAKASRGPPAEWSPRGTTKLTPAQMAESSAPGSSKQLEELLAASEKEQSLQSLLAEEQEKRRAAELQLIAEREGLEGLQGQLAALAEERQQLEARREAAERSEAQLREELAAGARQLAACEARLQGAEADREAALAQLRAAGAGGGAAPGEEPRGGEGSGPRASSPEAGGPRQDFHPPARAAVEPKEASSVGSAGSRPGSPPPGAGS